MRIRASLCGRTIGALGLACVMAACAANRPPPVVTVPKFPAYPRLEVPADLSLPPEGRQRFDDGWQRLQGGDLRGASNDFSDVLKVSPGFYPADTGLGYVALAQKQFKQAAARFSAALSKNARYLPALQGEVDAALGAGDDAATIAALEQILAVDPSREQLRGRLDLLRLRVVQSELTAGTRARDAGHLDEAQAIFERALQASPSSSVILRELATVETAQGNLAVAEEHARRAVQLDSSDAESLAVLAGALEAEGKSREAADAYHRAVAIDARPAWRQKAEALVARANLEALPPDYRAIPTAATVTRGQLAAMIGIDLESMIDQAPRKPAVVITDVRTHWAAPWILPVAQAGVMDVFANHTFQPNSTVRRSDLAHIVSQLLNLIAARRPDAAAKWRTGPPRVTDVPAGHVSFRAIAAAVAAGALTVDDDGRFWPGRAATGAEVVAAIARVRQLAGR